MPSNASFFSDLFGEIVRGFGNYFGEDNWDSDRFGELKQSNWAKLFTRINKLTNTKRLAIIPIYPELPDTIESIIEEYGDGLNNIYDLLEDNYSKQILIKVIAYRLLGFRKVKLPLNNSEYLANRKKIDLLVKGTETLYVDTMNWRLSYYDLEEIGYPIKLFYHPLGINPTFIQRQYEYTKSKPSVRVEPGDFVIDAGACWGDTALYFAHEAGSDGRVFCFEFIKNNLDILERNLKENPALQNKIQITNRPLGRDSTTVISYVDRGAGSRVIFNNFPSEKKIQTISIDDFVNNNNIPKINFIKMDIEGSEFNALQGAIRTLNIFRPKLAISLYHDINDFVSIPEFLISLKLGYKFYLDHFTFHNEETILYGVA